MASPRTKSTISDRSPSLQDQLDNITASTRSLVQPERLAITDSAVEALFSTGIEDCILQPGALAPTFTLPDALTGRPVHSADLLAVGPLILTFFRGRWCPYCMTELESWQTLYTEVRQRGALLVAVSPQTLRQNDFTVQRHNLTFPLLTDAGCQLATQFGVTYTVPEPLQRHYRSILVNIPFINGDQSWQLPLPSTFVLSPSGHVTYAEAHADHRVRPNPHHLLSTLPPPPPSPS